MSDEAIIKAVNDKLDAMWVTVRTRCEDPDMLENARKATCKHMAECEFSELRVQDMYELIWNGIEIKAFKECTVDYLIEYWTSESDMEDMEDIVDEEIADEYKTYIMKTLFGDK